jgi:hypothetical protein
MYGTCGETGKMLPDFLETLKVVEEYSSSHLTVEMLNNEHYT